MSTYGLRLLLVAVALPALFSCGGDQRCATARDFTTLDLAAARARFAELSSLCVLEPPTVPGSGKLVLRAGVEPFALTTTLFADYATSLRTISMPAGTHATYVDGSSFEFPVGTAFTQTLSYPADLRQPTENVRLVETRVLLNTSKGWLALPYVWNAAQTEATLDPLGSLYTQPFVDTTGTMRTPAYAIPSSNQCLLCHEGTHPTRPLGFKARLLNLPSPFATSGQTVNQLDDLSARGVISGAPAAASAPRTPAAHDPGAGTLDERARGWLDVNCAHCHSATGGARGTGLYLTHDEPDPFLRGTCKPPIASGAATGGRPYDLVPGQPDQSILPYRLDATELGKVMPPIARSLVDAEGSALIKEWITSLPGSCN